MRSRRPGKPGPEVAGSNLAGRDTALPEALWRADELAAALRTAQAMLAARERELVRAEETIAELSEIIDAAQAALVRSQEKAAEADQAARRDQEVRDAVAAELFRVTRRNSGRSAGARDGHGLDLGENVPILTRGPFSRRWWARLWRARD